MANIKYEELQKQINEMSEIERSKYVAILWDGLFNCYKYDKERGIDSFANISPFMGVGYFWNLINACGKASGQHFMGGKEGFEKWLKEHMAKREQQIKESDDIRIKKDLEKELEKK